MIKSLLLISCLLMLCQANCLAGDIHQAALMGDVTKICYLAECDPSVVCSKDDNGLTPLFWTVYADEPKAAEALIDLKAELNCKDESGETPLHVAVTMANERMVELLVSRGANVNGKDKSGATPLQLAQQMRNKIIIDLLHGKKRRVVEDASAIPSLALKGPGFENTAQTTYATLEPTRKAGPPGTKAVNFYQTKVRSVPVNVITVNLNDARVAVSAAISQTGIGTDESFGSFIKRCKPTAAINGTFFSKSNLKPVGDIVVDGELAHWGGMGTGVCLTEDCKAEIVTVERHKKTDWSEFNTVICCGPRLLNDGKVMLNPSAEGFRDPHVLGKASRTAIGITSGNKMIIANTSKGVTLSEWANVMKVLGCTDSTNLDGGASTAMYYRGKTISSPGRKLTNVLLVYENAGAPKIASSGK